jgi:Flp pilus assembly protein TadD
MAAEFLIKINAGQLAERALSQEILSGGNKGKAYRLLAKLENQRKNFKAAEEHIREAINAKQDDPNAWATLGLCNQFDSLQACA